MNTWVKIKNNIYQEKLNEIDSLFNSSETRNVWNDRLQYWAYNQRNDNYNSLGLTLAEYNEVKNNCEDKKSVAAFKEQFKEYYKTLLDQKEDELKLEIVAELVEENKVPLDIFVEWYSENKHLPAQQFKETLGEFWGDVSKHAKYGAAAGALGGAAAGALGTGGLGTFAGAGLGGLAGGIGGGVYGAGKHLLNKYGNTNTGKHLLRKVWNWRNNQTEFEKTKKEAYEILKKLKKDSMQFELTPNFHQLLDAMIQELGTVKAYKVKTSEKPEPTQQLPQVNQVSAPVGGTQTNVSAPTNIMHQSNTGTSTGSHVANVGAGIHDLPSDFTPKKRRIRKSTEIEPTAVKEETPIASKEDVLNYLDKPGLNEKELNDRLIKLGLALNIVGDPQDKSDYDAIDFELLRHGLMHDVTNMPNEEKQHYREKALAYQNYLAKKITTEPEKQPIPNQPQQYVAEKDPVNMPTATFKEFLREKGMWQDNMSGTLGKPGSDKRLQFIADNGVNESILEKYKNLLKLEARPKFIEHKIGYLTFEDRIQFYKNALRGL